MKAPVYILLIISACLMIKPSAAQPLASQTAGFYDTDRAEKQRNQQIGEPTFSKETVVISTEFGEIKIKLFNETPLHRDNFLKLVKQGFYDSLLFHRVIEQFMIQGGDPYSKHAGPNVMLGDSDLHYTIPAEFNPKLFHRKGMLCAARESDDKNPTKASSACQFYIVQGRVFNDQELKAQEYRQNKALLAKITADIILNDPAAKALQDRIHAYESAGNKDSMAVETKRLDAMVKTVYEKTEHYTFTPEQVQAYKTVGGTPHLDRNYTVFGQVIEGLDVLDKIAAVATNRQNRPLRDIRMNMRIE
ncbi:MAG: peptidylprolyl isomerase [Bacteroidetes bacterium]|nr:peptidylprolyl isomerase [Bacteroidota bacterium]